ncbi:hypothetical protein Hanom_Chr14g01270301 [Helianthus anomalus]
MFGLHKLKCIRLRLIPLTRIYTWVVFRFNDSTRQPDTINKHPWIGLTHEDII